MNINTEQAINIFDTPEELAEKFAGEFNNFICRLKEAKKSINIALSGGNTPKLFFDIFAEKYASQTDWKDINIYWVDERCVPPGDSESNYGMTKKHLFDKIEIPSGNIHRIRGEEPPEEESNRYSSEIAGSIPFENNLPRFDVMLLGMGTDGHTASIFPDHIEPLNADEISLVTSHPLTHQKRITLSGAVINNSVQIYFLICGSDKAHALSGILNRYPEAGVYPAFHIQPLNGNLSWFIDKNAAELL